MVQKRSRRTRAELRDLMLQAGLDVLFEIEPTLGFEQLSYSAVFARLQAHYDQRVTIGSVHERIWKCQRDFQLDVVAQALSQPLPATTQEVLAESAKAIERLPRTTPAERRYALQTAVRLNSYHLRIAPSPDATNLAHAVRFRLWSLGPDHPEAAGFRTQVRDLRAASTNAYIEIVHALNALIGLQVRSDAGNAEEAIEAFAIAGNAVMVGLMTDLAPGSQRRRELPTGPQGELEEWYPDAAALWANTRAVFELAGDDLTADERRL